MADTRLHVGGKGSATVARFVVHQHRPERFGGYPSDSDDECCHTEERSGSAVLRIAVGPASEDGRRGMDARLFYTISSARSADAVSGHQCDSARVVLAPFVPSTLRLAGVKHCGTEALEDIGLHAELVTHDSSHPGGGQVAEIELVVTARSSQTDVRLLSAGSTTSWAGTGGAAPYVPSKPSPLPAKKMVCSGRRPSLPAACSQDNKKRNREHNEEESDSD